MTGEQLIPAPQQATWDALNDPEVLKACVPGCESITLVNENEYQVLMVAKVGPVSAKFRGRLSLSNIKPPHSYALAFQWTARAFELVELRLVEPDRKGLHRPR